MKNSRGFEKGFTLIELLVVISIIALLSSIILASLSNARGNARDARRMEDLSQIQVALELYYNAHGSYPVLNTVSPPTACYALDYNCPVPYASSLARADTGEADRILAPLAFWKPSVAQASGLIETWAGNWAVLQTDLKPYIGVLPADPLGAGSSPVHCAITDPGGTPKPPGGSPCYGYYYASNLTGTAYDLFATLENPGNANSCKNRHWQTHVGLSYNAQDNTTADYGPGSPDTATDMCPIVPDGVIGNGWPALYSDHQ